MKNRNRIGDEDEESILGEDWLRVEFVAEVVGEQRKSSAGGKGFGNLRLRRSKLKMEKRKKNGGIKEIILKTRYKRMKKDGGEKEVWIIEVGRRRMKKVKKKKKNRKQKRRIRKKHEKYDV